MINQTFPKGAALAQWAYGAGVRASTTMEQIVVNGSEHSVTSVNPPTTEGIYLPNNSKDSQNRRSSQYLSFNTPVGTPEAVPPIVPPPGVPATPPPSVMRPPAVPPPPPPPKID